MKKETKKEGNKVVKEKKQLTEEAPSVTRVKYDDYLVDDDEEEEEQKEEEEEQKKPGTLPEAYIEDLKFEVIRPSNPEPQSKQEQQIEEQESKDDDNKMMKPKKAKTKDWNKKFQKQLRQNATSVQAKVNRSIKVYIIALEFQQAAKEIGSQIISELKLPLSQRKFPPSKGFGGIAGGEKYLHNGIFFKFVYDINKIYGGDEFAMKVARIELNGLRYYFNFINQHSGCGLGVSLMAVIDYKGYRLVATSLLPLSSDSLLYGSKDGGNNVYTKDPVLNAIMKKAGEWIGMKGHIAGIPNKGGGFVYAPGDIEGHKGDDGNYYVLDTARCTPPFPISKTFSAVRINATRIKNYTEQGPQYSEIEVSSRNFENEIRLLLADGRDLMSVVSVTVPLLGGKIYYISNNNSINNSVANYLLNVKDSVLGDAIYVPDGMSSRHLYQLMKNEFVFEYCRREDGCLLSPDSFSGFGVHKIAEHNTESRMAFRCLKETVKTFAEQLDTDVNLDFSVEELHKRGINIRLIGRIYVNMEKRTEIKNKIMIEMVTRAMKCMLRRIIRNSGDSNPIPDNNTDSNNEQIWSSLIKLLNLLTADIKQPVEEPPPEGPAATSDQFWTTVVALKVFEKFGVWWNYGPEQGALSFSNNTNNNDSINNDQKKNVATQTFSEIVSLASFRSDLLRNLTRQLGIEMNYYPNFEVKGSKITRDMIKCFSASANSLVNEATLDSLIQDSGVDEDTLLYVEKVSKKIFGPFSSKALTISTRVAWCFFQKSKFGKAKKKLKQFLTPKLQNNQEHKVLELSLQVTISALYLYALLLTSPLVKRKKKNLSSSTQSDKDKAERIYNYLITILRQNNGKHHFMNLILLNQLSEIQYSNKNYAVLSDNCYCFYKLYRRFIRQIGTPKEMVELFGRECPILLSLWMTRYEGRAHTLRKKRVSLHHSELHSDLTETSSNPAIFSIITQNVRNYLQHPVLPSHMSQSISVPLHLLQLSKSSNHDLKIQDFPYNVNYNFATRYHPITIETDQYSYELNSPVTLSWKISTILGYFDSTYSNGSQFYTVKIVKIGRVPYKTY